MKRVMTLVAAILGTVLTSVYTLISLIDFATTMEAIRAGAYVQTAVAINSVWSFVMAVPAVVLNALSITAFRCTHEQYLKRRPILIAATVFNFVWALGLVIGFVAISISAFEILLFLAFVATGVLTLVDFSQENNRLEKAARLAEAATVTEAAPAEETEQQ